MAPVVANTLDERVFCYQGLPEQIHTDQGVQIESQLMAKLRQLKNRQDEWNLLLPQLMRPCRGTPSLRNRRDSQHVDVETELRLPDQLKSHPPPTEFFPAYERALKMQRRLQMMHEALQQSQIKLRQEDGDEPPLYTPGDWVWLTNKRRRRGEISKLQAKFKRPYQVLKAWGNHTYLMK
ncbi:uncharacterized protein [Watersipora subatra]|uniref:uncharacterized protein n=1 Tax=Watersipora subatra TaxID=2589382 RepID=UPI00355BF804